MPTPTRVPAIPMRTPIVDGNGMITRTWALLMEQIVGAIGGIGGVSEDLSSSTTWPPRGYVTITPSGGVAAIDLGQGDCFAITLDGTPVAIAAPTWVNPIPAGSQIVIYVNQDATGGRNKPTWATGVDGYASDLSEVNLDPAANTQTTFRLTYHGAGSIWALDSTPRKSGATS